MGAGLGFARRPWCLRTELAGTDGIRLVQLEIGPTREYLFCSIDDRRGAELDEFGPSQLARPLMGQ
jgi:hypothetical protein